MSGTSYPLAGGEEVSLPRRLSDARNVLVLDAPRTASESGLWTDAYGIGPRTDGPVLLVAFTRSDVTALERARETDRAVYVLDATPQGTVAEEAESDMTVETVSSPSNLTDVGVALDKLCSAIEPEPADGRPVCWLPSLTALLQYVDRQRGYRFLNAMSNRLASVDAFAHYHLDAGAHDDRTVETFASLMDAVVSPTDDGVELRHR